MNGFKSEGSTTETVVNQASRVPGRPRITQNSSGTLSAAPWSGNRRAFLAKLFGRPSSPPWSQCRMAAARHFMVNDVKLPQYRPSRAFRSKCMKMRICFACMSAALFIAAIGVARADGACRFEVLGTGKVAKVVDGRSFVMEDGREVRIAGIEVPPAPASGEPLTPLAHAGAAAKAALAAILLDQVVELRGREHVTDRYGRTVAFVERANDVVAAAGVMRALLRRSGIPPVRWSSSHESVWRAPASLVSGPNRIMR